MAARPFPVDFTALKPDSRPRRWLVLPEGFPSTASADQISPVFAASPEDVLDAFRAAALDAPRTRLMREGGGQIEIVQRSAVFRFADYISAAAFPADGGAALAVYSRAGAGYYDFRVNEKRVRAWLDETARRLA